MKTRTLLLITLFVVGALAKVTVLSPDSFELVKKNETINYTIADFGDVPYGQSITGEVIIADPENGCNPLALNNTNKSSFILIKRGECTFVTKVRNAQQYGAKMALVYDNTDERTDNIILKDDGFAFDIKIPTIMIDKAHGEKIASFLKNHNEKGEINRMELSVDFLIETAPHVNLTFWISTSDRKSFKLIHEFYPYWKELAGVSTFTPHYLIWICNSCQTNKFSVINENCLSGGRYCAPVN